MAVSINLDLASAAIRYQDELFEKSGGKAIPREMLLFSDLGRMVDQRFVGFAEGDWSTGIPVDVRGTLRLFIE